MALIRSVLIGRGSIEATLEEQLERAFPNAKHNEVVEWQGKKFRHLWVHEGADGAGRNMWSRAWKLTH